MGGLTTRQLASRPKRRSRSGRHDQLQPGEMLQNRYRIIGTLGTGGFSSVYQARDMRFPNVTRLCAIKEMIDLSTDPNVRDLTAQSFSREANALATLDHPAIPEVYDFFSEGDRSYLVIEFIRGKDLEAMLAEMDTFLPEVSVVDWALQICDVLSYLHGHQPQPLVFRDLKPSNIMLDPHGRIRLIDFGIARVFESGEKGTMIGTEGYSPPEQYRGEGSSAGDVYALGATLHHLLTRQDPRLETPFTFAERPVRAINPQVSPGLEKIVMRCVAYSPDDRYPDAMAVREALQAVVSGSAAQAPESVAAPAPADNGQPGQPAPAVASVASDLGIEPIWRFKCEDEIRSMPAVADGVVYVGAYDNNLYAVRGDNGEFQWKYAAEDGIAGAPGIYQDTIFIGSADRHLYSIRRSNGHLNWRFQAGGPIYTSPRAAFDHVFFGSDDGLLYAVNVTNGRAVWTASAHAPVRSSAAVSDNHVYFGTEGGYVFCVDLRGASVWQQQARRAVTSSPALADDDMLVVGSMDGTLYGLDASSGWPLWKFRSRRPIISSPAVDGDAVYVGSSDGNLYAVNRHSGQKIWEFATEGQVASSPAVHAESVYFGCTDGSVFCLDTQRGKVRWRFQTDGMVVSSPVVADGMVYIGSADHHLYALPL